jgi:hypothetical protein
MIYPSSIIRLTLRSQISTLRDLRHRNPEDGHPHLEESIRVLWSLRNQEPVDPWHVW